MNFGSRYDEDPYDSTYSAGRSRRPRSLKVPIIAGIVALLAVAGMVLFAKMSYSTPPDQVALAYNDGPFANRTYDKMVPVSTREMHGPFDVEFAYPANQREFDFTGADGADAYPFGTEGNPTAVVSDDSIRFDAVGGRVGFLLNTNEDVLREFHEKFGLRYGAYFDGTESEGWQSNIVRRYIQQAVASALQDTASDYTWRELYSDANKREEWRVAAEKLIPAKVNAAMEGEEQFFTNFTLRVDTPQLPQNLRDALLLEQRSVAEAQAAEAKGVADAAAAEAKANAQVSQAAAETRVAEEKARAKAAEIAAHGGPAEYRRYLCSTREQNPCNPDQPSYVVTAPAAPTR